MAEHAGRQAIRSASAEALPCACCLRPSAGRRTPGRADTGPAMWRTQPVTSDRLGTPRDPAWRMRRTQPVTGDRLGTPCPRAACPPPHRPTLIARTAAQSARGRFRGSASERWSHELARQSSEGRFRGSASEHSTLTAGSQGTPGVCAAAPPRPPPPSHETHHCAPIPAPATGHRHRRTRHSDRPAQAPPFDVGGMFAAVRQVRQMVQPGTWRTEPVGPMYATSRRTAQRPTGSAPSADRPSMKRGQLT